MSEDFNVKIVQDIDEAKKWWEKFSPHAYLYDEWDIRYCYYHHFQYELFFYVGYVNDQPIGLLPLQYSTAEKSLEFFGGKAMNDDRVFIKKGYEELVPEFYKAITKPARLEYIIGQEEFTNSLPVAGYRYILPLTKYSTVTEYLTTKFSSETRKTLQKKVRRIEREQAHIVCNNFSDIELLFQYNIAHFKEDSSFLKPYRQEIYHDLLKLPFQFFLLSFVVNGETQGVSFSILYNSIYYYISLGIHEHAIKDLFTFIHIKNIEQALTASAHTLDALRDDYGWKERWHLSKIPEYTFEKI